MSIPQHSRYLVERLLQAYCARICPPTARYAVALGYMVTEEHACIHEWRALHGVAALRVPRLVARFSFSPREGTWLLECLREGLWQAHSRLCRSRSFVQLLREFDADPNGDFWGRIDGKSLRWCRSAGRCPGCTERYARILGLDTSTEIAAS